MGDGAATGSGIVEGGIVAHDPEIIVIDLDLAQIDAANRTLGDWNLITLAGATIGDRKTAWFPTVTLLPGFWR